jgi:hypothetical protein
VDISRHIVEFFKGLFGSPRLNNAHLEPDFYPREEQLGIAEKVLLSSLFYKIEVARAINGMKSDFVPGSNCFTVIFFKKLWVCIKDGIIRQ